MKKQFYSKTAADRERETREEEERSWCYKSHDPFELAVWCGKKNIWNLKPDCELK